MVVNEEGRQVKLAEILSVTAQSVAHSTRNVPSPPDSYILLGELSAAQHSIAQVLAQLADWHHTLAARGVTTGEDRVPGTDTPADMAAWQALGLAARDARNAAAAIDQAHVANGAIRFS
ncbi:hypothetical protein [Leifsonia sp. Leaf264]|uniref:hypothetical protein n=1 Tax=Leifsonia sp. Leaf264 TaxID=1736314 RepID=UPI000700768A|nr:hypothetical protein [Leifsonia sp. Leaf264]KQO98480.1 hypothetical protein ASF30_10485 [Leifsonia sp. Leaf264]